MQHHVGDVDPAASSARTTSVRRTPPSSRRTATPRWAAIGSPKRCRTASTSSPSSCARRHRLDARPADRRLQLGRRALGDDRALVDDPDPVGEHVGLLEVLRGQEDGHALVPRKPAPPPRAPPALRVEAGGRLVEEEDPRPVDEGQREVEAPLHPAGVRAHLAVGGLREADAVEELVRPARTLAARRVVQAICRRRCSRPVRSGSSAASWSAAPMTRRTFGPRGARRSRRRGGSAGRREQRGQHVHRRRLAGAVRAEEAVDLAVGDDEVDAVHRAHVLERALEPFCFDRPRHRPA